MYVATSLDSNFSISNVLARGKYEALYLEIKARGGSQTWTVVSPKEDLVIYVAN